MTSTLAEALHDIGLAPPFSWRRTITGPRPRRLSELIAACRPPRMADWTNPTRSRVENQDYTEEANGMVTDGSAWYVTSNADDRREGLYKLVLGFDVLGRLAAPLDPDDTHLGSLCVRDGLLYVPCQRRYGIWVVSSDLQSSTFLAIDQLPDGDLFAWCDIHPANGLIYTCNFSNPTQMRAYEIASTQAVYRPEQDIPILQPGDGKRTDQVQSACFTSHYRWFAVCDVDGAERIHCHTTLTGRFLDRRTLRASADEDTWPHSQPEGRWPRNELEGIRIHPLQTTDGTPVEVHVLEPTTKRARRTIFHLLHFSAPDPSALWAAHFRATGSFSRTWLDPSSAWACWRRGPGPAGDRDFDPRLGQAEGSDAWPFLLGDVERTVRRMPLGKLQTVGSRKLASTVVGHGGTEPQVAGRRGAMVRNRFRGRDPPGRRTGRREDGTW